MGSPGKDWPEDVDLELDALCDRFEAEWKGGGQPSLEAYVAEFAQPDQPRVLHELWQIELYYRVDAQGEKLDDAQLRELHPALAMMLDEFSRSEVTIDAAHRSDDGLQTTWAAPNRASQGLHIRCPHCSNPVELLPDAAVDDVSCTNCGSQFSLVSESEPYQDGKSLTTLGRFNLIARIGVGGFGAVWKAYDTELQRIVAVKIPRKGNMNARDVEQFLREARAAAQLRHPSIVPVFEVCREQDKLFIVSEFVDGQSVADWMKDERRSAPEAAKLCAVVADALEVAHNAGIVHRDLKPSNVMLDSAGNPRLMDFGLAKREVGEVTMTLDGFVVGTPAYMSPEQARGESHWTDRRTDVYSLGVMLFHLLTDELPFRGAAPMQIQSRLTSDPPSPRSLDPSIPLDLATICLKCMELDPGRRYQTAQEVADELRRYLNGEPVLARPLPSVVRWYRWARRRPATATALALTVLLAVAGPAAALVINSQRVEILNRLNERDKLVIAGEARQDELQSQVSALEKRLELLTGAPLQSPTFEPWRREVAAAWLDRNLSRYQQQLSGADEPEEAARLNRALGDVALIADRRELAVKHYRLASSLREYPTTAAVADRIQSGLALTRLLAASGKTEEANRILNETQTQLEKLAADDVSVGVLVDRVESKVLASNLEPDANAMIESLRQSQQAKEALLSNLTSEIEHLPELRDRLLDPSR